MTDTPSDWRAILQFNQDLIAQGLDLVDALQRQPGQDFAQHCGPHLRHLVEHYEALLQGLRERRAPGAVAVAYDRRCRDRRLEREPRLMRRRLQGLQQALAALDPCDPDTPCAVELCGGDGGEQVWVSRSTLARELLFLASHTTHHYALIRSGLAERVQALPAGFGKAPATLRHEAAHERAA
jgi:hypothetical protein